MIYRKTMLTLMCAVFVTYSFAKDIKEMWNGEKVL